MGIGTFILVSLIKIVIAIFVLLTAVAYTTLLERKVVAHTAKPLGTVAGRALRHLAAARRRIKVYL